MNEDFDPNVIVAEYLKKYTDDFLTLAKGIFHGTTDAVRLRLDSTYRTYLAALLERYSKTKSFMMRGEPVPLNRFYVPLHLKHRDNIVRTPALADLLKRSQYGIIVGSAGCGKSMFIRHLLINALLTKTKVPIFIELRQFNTYEEDLSSLIHKTLSTLKFNLDHEYIAKAFDAGHFILFLDGFDEVIHTKRSDVTQFIHDFAKKFANNPVLVTSRPDPGLEGWQQFSLFQVAPLTIDQAHSLVEKLPYDEDLKAKFLLDLRTELFNKHRSFLSNPLLLSIMLLSYGQSATIPNKLTVFYNQAYEALYERHDTLKDGFRRKFLTSLDIQDFARLFSVFCLLAYDANKLDFTHTEALEHIERSEIIVGIDVVKDDYLKDLIQAVCLLVQDGLSIVYSHRSFQEYFAARFISEAKSDVQKNLIKKYSFQVLSDNVLAMLHEMRPEVVEQCYIVPSLNELFAYIGIKKRPPGFTNYRKFILALFDSVMIGPGVGGTIAGDQGMRFIESVDFALKRCGHLVGWKGYGGGPKLNAMSVKYQNILKSNEIDLQQSEHRDAFIKDLATVDCPFSLNTLQELFRIRDALVEKARRGEQSLENLLVKK